MPPEEHAADMVPPPGRPRVPGAVILGGAHGALAIARSLGRKGIPCVFVSDDHPLPKFSRYVGRRFDWQGPAAPGAAAWLTALAARENLANWLLVPCSDADVHFVALETGALSRIFRIVSCPWHDLVSLCDKQLLAQKAVAHGIDVPKAYTLASEIDAQDPQIRFPVVLKPATREQANPFTLAKAWRAGSPAELAARYRDAVDLVGAGHVVVQEFIPGGGDAQFSYTALWHEGRPLAELVARRTRQFPVEFSYTSTFVETAACEPVVEASRRLLSAIGFRGLVEVEYKFDARDGCYKVMDVNPRAWSWLSLAEEAGVDLAYLLFETASGGAPPVPAVVRPAAWLHASRDVLAAISLLWRGELTPGGYLRSLRGKRLVFASFAFDDPLPGLVELPLSALRVLTRRLLPRFRSGTTPPARDTGGPRGMQGARPPDLSH